MTQTQQGVNQEISASARYLQSMLARHCGVQLSITEAVRICSARARGGAEVANDPLMVARLAQLSIAEAKERGLPAPPIDAACKRVREQFSK